MKEKILQLRKSGKTYNEIIIILKCSKSLISYYCNPEHKTKMKIRAKRYRSSHTVNKKLYEFLNTGRQETKYKTIKSKTRQLIYWKLYDFFNPGKNKMNKPTINVEELLNSFGTNPRCYLTGESINLDNPSSYEFDHKIPVSRGGKSELDNLGLCTKIANRCKDNLLEEELVEFAIKLLKHKGYLN